MSYIPYSSPPRAAFPSTTPDEWVRPADWLAMPTVLSTDQTFVGLHAVFEVDDNFVALLAETSAGQYQVDWGDGTTTLHDSGVAAEYNYNYATYDVGEATLSTRGYKQAMIVVTAVSGDITALNLQQIYTGQNLYFSSKFLDCILSLPNATASGIVISASMSVIKHRYLERFDIKNFGACTTTTNLFNTCTSLQSVPLFDTSSVTDMDAMFIDCSFLQTVPLFDMSSVTNTDYMFYDCISLKEVPLFNMSEVTTMNYMFGNCSALQEVPLFDLSSGILISYMFYNCNSLQSVPLFDLSSATNISFMFNNCTSLLEVPLFDTSSAVTMDSLLLGCTSLQSVPIFNMSSATDISGMLQGCTSLLEVPLFDLSGVSDVSYLFAYCSGLQTVPLFDTSAVISMRYMFQYCDNLREVPLFDTNLVDDMSFMFQYCPSLLEVPLFDTSSVNDMSYMFAGCTGLRTTPLFNTVSVLSMGYMFFQCYSLQEVPLYNTANVTNMSGMFHSCQNLQVVPLFDTANVTNMSYMFYLCYGLQTVPLFDTANVTAMIGMFSNCLSLVKIPALSTVKILSASGTDFSTTFANSCFSLRKCSMEFARTVSFLASGLGKDAIIEIFNNLIPRGINSSRTITITNNYGADTALSKTSCGTTSGSAVVTQSNTSSLVVGMLVTGTGINTARAVTLTDVGDLVNLTAHGLANGTIISFTTRVTTTGIVIFTPYYVVNATANNFQVSATLGGSALPLTTNGSGTINFASFIVSINPNVSFTLDRVASANGTVTLSSRLLNVSIATLKGWTVTG